MTTTEKRQARNRRKAAAKNLQQSSASSTKSIRMRSVRREIQRLERREKMLRRKLKAEEIKFETLPENRPDFLLSLDFKIRQTVSDKNKLQKVLVGK